MADIHRGLMEQSVNDRVKYIMELMKQHGSVQVNDVAEALGVSTATVRRDLQMLEDKGLLQRVYGGALPTGFSTTFEYLYHDKMDLRTKEKERIAQAAAEEVQNGEAVFLDSGTTAYKLAQKLQKKQNLTIATVDLSIAALIYDPTTQVVLTGGIVRQGYNVLVGSTAENFIRDMCVDKVFLTADAVDLDFGISNANYLEAGVKQQLAHAGRKTILVTDHSKFGKEALTRYCRLQDIHMIITDDGLPRDTAAKIREMGINLKCV